MMIKGRTVRKLIYIVSNVMFKIFSGTGKRSNCWSAVTIRLALVVYCRSPAAYDALKSFELLQLPSRSTLQAYTGAFLEDCGMYNDCHIILHDVHVLLCMNGVMV